MGLVGRGRSSHPDGSCSQIQSHRLILLLSRISISFSKRLSISTSIGTSIGIGISIPISSSISIGVASQGCGTIEASS